MSRVARIFDTPPGLNPHPASKMSVISARNSRALASQFAHILFAVQEEFSLKGTITLARCDRCLCCRDRRCRTSTWARKMRAYYQRHMSWFRICVRLPCHGQSRSNALGGWCALRPTADYIVLMDQRFRPTSLFQFDASGLVLMNLQMTLVSQSILKDVAQFGNKGRTPYLQAKKPAFCQHFWEILTNFLKELTCFWELYLCQSYMNTSECNFLYSNKHFPAVQAKHFKKLATVLADEIVQSWINYFVYHKKVVARRLREIMRALHSQDNCAKHVGDTTPNPIFWWKEQLVDFGPSYET